MAEQTNNRDMSDEQDRQELEDRIDELEQTIAKMLPGRRDALKLGGAALLGGAAMSGTAGDTVFQAIASLPQPDVGHFKADSLALADGDPVTSWGDQSTNNVDVSVSGGTPIFAANDLNGLPGVDFNGGDFQSDSSFSFGVPLVSYVVWDYADVNDEETIYDGLNDFSPQLRINPAPGLTLADGGRIDSGGVNLDGPLAIKAVIDGTNSRIELNGNVIISGDAGNVGRPSGFTFGDLNDLRGGGFQSFSTMYEFAEYQNPSQQVQADAEAALSDKWGVTF